jgi:hypothetical protein
MDASGPLLGTADIRAHGSVRLTAVPLLWLLCGAPPQQRDGYGARHRTEKGRSANGQTDRSDHIRRRLGPVDQRRPLLGDAIRLAWLIVRSQRITARATARHFISVGSGVIVFLIALPSQAADTSALRVAHDAARPRRSRARAISSDDSGDARRYGPVRE